MTVRKIALPDAHQRACARSGVSRTYFMTYSAIMKGIVQAERIGSRLYVDEAEIPKIAEHLATLGPTKRRNAA